MSTGNEIPAGDGRRQCDWDGCDSPATKRYQWGRCLPPDFDAETIYTCDDHAERGAEDL